VIRESGTEPVVRVMAEAENEALVERVVDDLCETLTAAANRLGEATSEAEAD
jgi:phosphoglucosamine mutase